MSREINMSNAMPKIETFLEWLDKILWGDRSTLWSGSNELAIWSDKSILLILPHLDFTHTWLIYKTTTYFAEFLVADKVSHFFIVDDDNSGSFKSSQTYQPLDKNDASFDHHKDAQNKPYFFR